MNADNRALAEYGFRSWHAFTEALASSINDRLQRLPQPCMRHGERLFDTTVRFIASKWFADVVARGWPLVELFGIGPHAPMIRVEQQGLVTWLALSAFSGGRLIEIEEGLARVQYPTGSVQTYQCGMPAMDRAVLWWECAAIVGDDHEL
jgi:hypothetical protein